MRFGGSRIITFNQLLKETINNDIITGLKKIVNVPLVYGVAVVHFHTKGYFIEILSQHEPVPINVIENYYDKDSLIVITSIEKHDDIYISMSNDDYFSFDVVLFLTDKEISNDINRKKQTDWSPETKEFFNKFLQIINSIKPIVKTERY